MYVFYFVKEIFIILVMFSIIGILFYSAIDSQNVSLIHVRFVFDLWQ
jgi:hypothetical protein